VLTVLVAILPATDVNATLGVYVRAMAVVFSVLPLSFVMPTLWVSVSTLSVPFALRIQWQSERFK
jgi:hypothetical protein